jgi:hypothetical protein
MNATVYRMLKGYLGRSVGLYAISASAIYIMLSAFWALRFGRTPLAGILLGVWGSVAAVNTRSLVWRSLPIEVCDIAMFRWWAAIGVPGALLTLITMLSWGAQFLSGLPTPSAPQILLGVLANWAALAVMVALGDDIRYSPAASKAVRAAKTLVLAALGAILTIYGLPIGLDTPVFSFVFVGAGWALLILGVLHALRASDKQWVYGSSRARYALPWSSATTPTGWYGLKVLYMPTLRYTAILTAAAIVSVAVMHKLVSGKGFAQADTIVLLIAFVGLSTSGYLLPYRLRTATQTLRCLPLSVHRLAGLLQLMGVLPGLMAALLTLVTARWLLHFDIDAWAGVSFALTLFGALGSVGQPQKWQQPQLRGPFVQRWLPLIQSLMVPAWFALMAANLVSSGIWYRPWVQWPWLAVGAFLCVWGHYVLVQQLRAGIRPSANQQGFSVG